MKYSAESGSQRGVRNFADRARQLQKDPKPWSLPRARDQKKIVPIVGSGAASTIEGVAPLKRDFWELSVSRLKEDTTADKLRAHLHSHHIEVQDVFVFPSKVKGTIATKVRVDLQHRDQAKNQDIWLENIRVQDWIYKPKSARKENL